MKNREETKYIYHNRDGSHEPVTEDEFNDFYHYASNFRRTQQRNGLCCCKRDKWMLCDTDCAYCPFQMHNETLSLDYTVADDEGNERSWLEQISGEGDLLEDIIGSADEVRRALLRIEELMPEALVIGRCRLEGMSEEAIAEEIGIGRKTFAYRLKKLKSAIEEDFPEIF